MNLERIANRFAKNIPEDYDFYGELEKSCSDFLVGGIQKDAIKIAKLCVMVIYGMLIRKSSLCAMIAVAPLMKLLSEDDIETVLKEKIK